MAIDLIICLNRRLMPLKDRLLYSTFFVVILFSGLPGLFASSDFFTLWGMHPKWEWATADWFVHGTQLPSGGVMYQSFLGTLLGKGVRIFSPQTYPDSIWVIFVLLILTITFFYYLRLFKNLKAVLPIILIFLFLTKPHVWHQVTFGGYVDFVVSLTLAIATHYLFSNKATSSAYIFFITVILKPTAWPFVAICLLAHFFSHFFQKKPEKSLWKLYLPSVLLVATHQWLLGILYATDKTGPSLMEVLNNGSLDNALYFPVYFFSLSNFSVLLIVLALFWASAEVRVKVLFLTLGFMSFMTLLYTFVFLKTPYEAFASSHRYILLYIFTCLPLLLNDPAVLKKLQPKRIYFLGALILVSVARVAEDLPRILKVDPWSGIDKNTYLADNSWNIDESCSPTEVEIKWASKNGLSLQKNTLQELQFYYAMLPLKVKLVDKANDCGPCTRALACE